MRPSDTVSNVAGRWVMARCPQDGMLLVLPVELAGKNVGCPGCSRAFLAPSRTFGEEEWRTCQDVAMAFRYLELRHVAPGARKLRLLGCAVCSLCWERLDDQCRQALRVAECFADGLAGEAEREAALAGTDRHLQQLRRGYPLTRAWHWARRLGLLLQPQVGFHPDWLRPPLPPHPRGVGESALLREVVGDPFRARAPEPAWLAWNGGTVPRLAATISETRGFDQMPVLADALEEAGCTDADVLRHCREAGVHVRGCWVLDQLLGRE
jgi:hypothetical protein